MMNELKNKIIRALVKRTTLDTLSCRMVLNQMTRKEVNDIYDEREVK